MKRKITLAVLITLIISLTIVLVAWYIGNKFLQENTLYTDVVDNINDKNKVNLLKSLTEIYTLDPSDDGFSYNLYKNKVILDVRNDNMLINFLKNNSFFTNISSECLNSYLDQNKYIKNYQKYFEGEPTYNNVSGYVIKDNVYYYDSCNTVDNERTIVSFNYKYDFDGTYYYVYQAAGYYLKKDKSYIVYSDFNTLQMKSEVLNVNYLININNYNEYANYKLKFSYENNIMKLIGIEEI